jgi:hypothetical protein
MFKHDFLETNFRKIGNKNSVPHLYKNKKCNPKNIKNSNPKTKTGVLRTNKKTQRFQSDGGVLRISKKSGHVLPWPERKRAEVNLTEAQEGPKVCFIARIEAIYL